MLVVMDQKATPAEIDAVVAAIEERGYTARPIPGGERVSIGILNVICLYCNGILFILF